MRLQRDAARRRAPEACRWAKMNVSIITAIFCLSFTATADDCGDWLYSTATETGSMWLHYNSAVTTNSATGASLDPDGTNTVLEIVWKSTSISNHVEKYFMVLPYNIADGRTYRVSTINGTFHQLSTRPNSENRLSVNSSFIGYVTVNGIRSNSLVAHVQLGQIPFEESINNFTNDSAGLEYTEVGSYIFVEKEDAQHAPPAGRGEAPRP